MDEASAARREDAASDFTQLLRRGMGNARGVLRSHDADGQELLPLVTQKACVKQLLAPEARRMLLAAHAPGAGKTTLGALAFAALHVLHGEDTTCVVACPAVVLPQWKSTLRAWLLLAEHELLAVSTLADATEAALARARIVLVSHGIVVLLNAQHQQASCNKAAAVADAPLFAQRRTLLVVDEAHLARNTSTRLCSALERMAAVCKYRLALTGSPVVNASGDMAGIATVIGAPMQFRSGAFWGKRCRVCEEALDAFRPHLHRVAERALKLPGMRQHDVLFDLRFTPEQADEYNAGLLQLQGIARRLANSNARAQDASVALSVLSKLQQYPVSFELARHGALNCPGEKLKNAHLERLSSHAALLQAVTAALGRGNRVCLFAMHTSVLAVAASVLAASDLGAKVVFYTGAVSTRTRAENLAYFKSTSDRVVMLLTIAAGGIGLHIGNGANQAVFWGSCGFTPASREQAIRRLLRYGQESKVDVYDVYARNTVEDGIRSIHTVKSAVTSAVVDRDLGPLQEVGGDRLLRIVDRLCLVDRDTGNALPVAESDADCTRPLTKRPALGKGAFASLECI